MGGTGDCSCNWETGASAEFCCWESGASGCMAYFCGCFVMLNCKWEGGVAALVLLTAAVERRGLAKYVEQDWLIN